jgi:hypothetical protein
VEGFRLLSITPELLDDTLYYLGDLFGWHCPNGKSEGARIAVPLSAQHHLEVWNLESIHGTAVPKETDVCNVMLTAGIETAADLDP